jgi:hypothetical protein
LALGRPQVRGKRAIPTLVSVPPAIAGTEEFDALQ